MGNLFKVSTEGKKWADIPEGVLTVSIPEDPEHTYNDLFKEPTLLLHDREALVGPDESGNYKNMLVNKDREVADLRGFDLVKVDPMLY